MRVALVVVLCISAGWYFVYFYGGKDVQAEQALPGEGAVTSASASRSGVSAMVSPTLMLLRKCMLMVGGLINYR